MNLTESYVSFEIAKLLKEKGFEECPLYRYDDCGQLWVQGGYNKTIKWHFPAPTLQMTLKWLRKNNFHIIVDIEVDYDEDERGMKWYHKPTWDWIVYRIDDRKQMSDNGDLYSTYEEACEAAIKYCLENLL